MITGLKKKKKKKKTSKNHDKSIMIYMYLFKSWLLNREREIKMNGSIRVAVIRDIQQEITNGRRGVVEADSR